MIGMLITELLKLKGSLAILMLLASPFLLFVLAALGVLAGDTIPTWGDLLGSFVSPLWALMLLPMTLTVLAALLAQIEHGSGAFTHVFALPIHRWAVFSTKIAIVVGSILVMSILGFGLALAGGLVGGLLRGVEPLGKSPLEPFSAVMTNIGLAAAFIAVLQAWLALRFRSFALSIGIGVAGTLVALAMAMTRPSFTAFWPWAFPLGVVTSARPDYFALLGLACAVAAFPLAVYDLSRRDVVA